MLCITLFSPIYILQCIRMEPIFRAVRDTDTTTSLSVKIFNFIQMVNANTQTHLHTRDEFHLHTHTHSVNNIEEMWVTLVCQRQIKLVQKWKSASLQTCNSLYSQCAHWNIHHHFWLLLPLLLLIILFLCNAVAIWLVEMKIAYILCV